MLRMNIPAVPGRARSGRNAKRSVAVQPSTAYVISRVPAIAASFGDSPFRMCRAMFSTTTMASSTRMPMEKIRAKRVMRFSV
jgi:hypothetical protein